jgi:hypothetical protein
MNVLGIQRCPVARSSPLLQAWTLVAGATALSNDEMQLTGGEGSAHAALESRARVVIKRRPQLISVLDGPAWWG